MTRFRQSWRYPLVEAGAIILVICLSLSSAAATNKEKENESDKGAAHATQTPEHSDETPPEPADPLGRSTPHGTLLGFLHAAQTDNYEAAAQYLQLSKAERADRGEALARELHELMDQVFVGRIGAVSDDPEGSFQAGVPRDRERIGVFRINRQETNVDLVHIPDPKAGDNVWLFSSETLAMVPELFGQIEGSKIESELPRFLVAERFFSTPLWRWIAFLLLVPLALLLSSAVVGVLRLAFRIWSRQRPRPVLKDLRDSFKTPSKLILAVAFHWIGVAFLGLPLLFREYYSRIAGILLAAGAAWLVVRVVNLWAERARVGALADSGYRSGSIILLGQRILTAVIVVVAGLVMLSILGFDMTTAVAGLGIGSVAVAFAAQKTLENLLGGISILGDQVIRVGETCRIDGEVGTVEDISLRSTRIRTIGSTQLSVPNGQLANMNIENLSRYDRSSFRTTIRLQIETSPDQLRSLLAKIRALLLDDPRVDRDVVRVHLTGFGESSLDVEIYCLVLTGVLGEFLAIREDLLLRIMDLVAGAGTQLALPSRTLHLAQDETADQKSPPVPEHKVFRRPQAG